jgi:dCMP deaminase
MRPSKEEYYLGIAKEVSKRATCFRAKIGAIIVRGDQIIATGYVGAPRKTKDCFEHGFCLRDKLNIPHGQRYELCRSVHAEQNAIINAARAGVSLLDGDMYVYGERLPEEKQFDCFPCFICKKLAINAGLARVISSTKEGGMKIFKVADWASDWQKGDILDDRHQYGSDQNALKKRKR